MLLNCDDDYLSQRNGHIREDFRALTKDDNLKPYASEHDFRSTNFNAAGEATNDIGYKICVFNKRYQKTIKTCSTN